jgi:hypothetical protein
MVFRTMMLLHLLPMGLWFHMLLLAEIRS